MCFEKAEPSPLKLSRRLALLRGRKDAVSVLQKRPSEATQQVDL